MREYEDWTDWAGDHPEQAEADLRAEREKAEERRARLFRHFTKDACEHEFHMGVCLICEAEDENYEPSDAVIFAHYGQTKEPGVAA